MEYVWNGDNKLCISGMPKIMPGGVVDIDENTLKIPGVIKLIGEGKLIVREQVAAPEVANEEPPVPVSDSQEVAEEPQKPPKKNRR